MVDKPSEDDRLRCDRCGSDVWVVVVDNHYNALICRNPACSHYGLRPRTAGRTDEGDQLDR